MVEPMVGPMAVLTERLRAVKSVSRSEMMEIGLEHSLVSMDDLLAGPMVEKMEHWTAEPMVHPSVVEMVQRLVDWRVGLKDMLVELTVEPKVESMDVKMVEPTVDLKAKQLAEPMAL